VLNALEALDEAGVLANPEGWLFRIAHNAALDFLRRRARQQAVRSDEDLDMIADHATPADIRVAAAASMRTFMRLPPAQRSSIILMDVLGYSLDEIEGVTDLTIPAIKASLHRGRARLRELAQEKDDTPLPVLAEGERALFAAYVDRFNARDFDAVRDMLADEVKLDLVNRRRLNGRTEVSKYFTNYSKADDWHLALGLVDRRPAMLVRDPAGSSRPVYFVLLEWTGARVAAIRDFRYAPYVADEAEVVEFP
jgi:RNA polymerase sigma-70 factor (ECF subfamily)